MAAAAAVTPSAGGAPADGSSGGSVTGHVYFTSIRDGGSGGGGGGGYGSINPPPLSPKIYNAPLAPSYSYNSNNNSSSKRRPPSGRSSQQQQQQQLPLPVMVRTNGSTSSNNNNISNNVTPIRSGNNSSDQHRRSNSDTPHRPFGHRRSGSAGDNAAGGMLLPPLGGGSAGGAGLPGYKHHNRARTLSGGNPLPQSPGNAGTGSKAQQQQQQQQQRPPHHPHHRRMDSAGSAHSYAGNSYIGGDGSMVSVRSNIAKSTLFAGVHDDGQVLLHYPYEAVRLVMVPAAPVAVDNNFAAGGEDTQPVRSHYGGYGGYGAIAVDGSSCEYPPPSLTIGHLYSEGPANIDDYYEEYHRIADDVEQGMTPQWESLDPAPSNVHPLYRGGGGGVGVRDRRGPNAPNSNVYGSNPHNPYPCGCPCTNCKTCIGAQQLLPPTNYCLAVQDDVYRRMLAEVADSQSMPCGLFFCGHHEDVRQPSIWIAAMILLVLFSGLSYVAFYTEGFVDS